MPIYIKKTITTFQSFSLFTSLLGKLQAVRAQYFNKNRGTEAIRL